MYGWKKFETYRSRWGERASRLGLAAIAAVAGRASAEDVAGAAVALVLLVGASEIIIELFEVARHRARIRELAKARALRRRLRRSLGGVGQGKRKARSAHR